MGVSVSIDGQPSRDVSTGETLTLDARAHTLAFSCPVCAPVDVAVSAGDKDDTLVVSVPMKPATLVVDGDVLGRTRSSSIPSSPSGRVRTAFRCGAPYEPRHRQADRDRRRRPVRLEAAKTVHAAFP